jgi:hypothetical protein
MGKRHDGGWSDDPRDLLRAHPDFELDDLERDATPGWSSGKKAARKFGGERGELLSELQERLFAEVRLRPRSRSTTSCGGSRRSCRRRV